MAFIGLFLKTLHLQTGDLLVLNQLKANKSTSKIRSEFQGDVRNFLLCLRNYPTEEINNTFPLTQTLSALRMWLREQNSPSQFYLSGYFVLSSAGLQVCGFTGRRSFPSLWCQHSCPYRRRGLPRLPHPLTNTPGNSATKLELLQGH